MKSISVFFPAHNEEDNIEEMVSTSVSYLESLHTDYEVLVICDHCTDKTESIVKKKFKNNPRVKAIVNDGVGGYGSALKKGFSSFTKDLVFFTDSDLQFDITELGKLLKHIDKYDYVIGYRMDRKDPFYRNINATAYGMLVKLMLGVHVKDLDCAFKVFRKEVIQSIDIHSNGALINAEILYKLNKKNYTFTQVGVHHYPRKAGKPTGANLKVIMRMFIELFKLKMNTLQ